MMESKFPAMNMEVFLELRWVSGWPFHGKAVAVRVLLVGGSLVLGRDLAALTLDGGG
jgi:hypothetical protein